jgi:hypothetical protein
VSDNCHIFDSVDSGDDDEGFDTSHNGYEFYEKISFPSGVNDVVHVGLANLCCRIKAPLYAYNKILQWAQSAYVQGYSFPTDAPHYCAFISSLKK